MILAMPSPTCTHLDQIEVSALPDAIVACCDERLKTSEEWSWPYVDEVALVVGE